MGGAGLPGGPESGQLAGQTGDSGEGEQTAALCTPEDTGRVEECTEREHR